MAVRDADAGANQSMAWPEKKKRKKRREDFLIFSSDIFIEGVSAQPRAPLRPLPESLREISVGFFFFCCFFFILRGSEAGVGGLEWARQPAGVH